MKKSVRDLEDRIIQLGLSPSDEERARLGAEAESVWLEYHLTGNETLEAARLLRSAKKGEISQDEGERRYGELLAKAAERAAREPLGLREEFIRKSVRAETLRHAGRRLTEGEGDELRALNAWLIPDPATGKCGWWSER